METMVEERENKLLAFNISETESMTVLKNPKASTCKLQSQGVLVKLVDKFKYLAYLLISDRKCFTEI